MEIELKEYLAPLRKWWWLVVVSTLIATVSSYLATRQQIPIYRSTTTLTIGSAFENPNPTAAEFTLTRQLASTYVDIAGRASVRSDVMEALGLETLPDDVVVRQLNDTNLIDITVADTDPRRAQAVANEFARQLVLRSPTAQEDGQEAFVNELLESYEAQITETQDQIVLKQEELGQLVSAREIAQVQEELVTLEDNLRNLSSSYSSLRNSTQQGATNTIRVIEPAFLPRNPVRPSNITTILTAAGIGFVLSASAAYILEYLDDTVRTPEALTRITALPTLAGIAQMKQGDQELVTVMQPRSPVSEAFRVLRTAIQYSAIDTPNKTLLITSPTPGDGKSMTSANLAVVIAQAGNNVLLIDTDLRRPSLHQMFNLPNKRGLTNLLLEFDEQATPEHTRNMVVDTVQVTEVEGLQVLTCGPLPPNPSELLGSVKMRHMLSALTQQFDFVLMDSSPALSVTDAAVLGAQADGTLLVVRAGKTRKEYVRHAVQRMQEVNANLMGCVLNGLDPKGEGYGMYYYYRDPYYAYGEEPAGNQEESGVGKLRKRLVRRQTV